MRFHVKWGARYYVGDLDGHAVYASRKYFAARYKTADAARKFIRENLRRWSGSLDSLAVVRVRLRVDEAEPPPACVHGKSLTERCAGCAEGEAGKERER